MTVSGPGDAGCVVLAFYACRSPRRIDSSACAGHVGESVLLRAQVTEENRLRRPIRMLNS